MLEKSLIKLLSRDRLSVFLFHKVPGEADPLLPADVTIAKFRQTLGFIRECFDVVPLTEGIDRVRSGRGKRPQAVITFDDGYEEWLHGVVPVLEEHGFPATFFITSSQFDGVPMWHERIAHAVRHAQTALLDMPGFGLPPLSIGSVPEKGRVITLLEQYLKYQALDTREQLLQQLEATTKVDPAEIKRFSMEDMRAIHARGFEIGAHTITHPILTHCTRKQAEEEIAGVREVLSAAVAGPIKSFAYPNGRPGADFGAEHIGMVSHAGYSYAVTTQWGTASAGTSALQVPRFTPWGPDTLHMALQVGRNLLTRPKLISLPGKSETNTIEKPKRVMVVENGAGFGGAIVALQILLAHYDPRQVQCHVVTNYPVGNFRQLASVANHVVVSDRLKDLRPFAKHIHQAELGTLGSLLLFALGRLDDLANRGPYLVKLLYQGLKFSPDVIHGNNEPNANREAMLVAKLLRKPYVQHVRGPLGPSRHTPWLLAAPDAFIPVSRWMAGDLLLAGVKPEKIRQIYDAVDLGTLQGSKPTGRLRAELGVADDVLLIAMVGMLVPWKGQDLFIDAVAKMRSKSERPTKYLLIGGTPERGDADYAIKLREQVAQAGLKDDVIFLGKRNDLPEILPEIDIVVSASTEPEPLGLVMLEAMISGCLFVGPAHGAATEVVRDGVNGLMFEPKSTKSLDNTLRRAVQVIVDKTMNSDEINEAVLMRFSSNICASNTKDLMFQVCR